MSARTEKEIHGAHRELYHARTDKILARILKACDGTSVHELDLRSANDEHSLLGALAKTFEFPNYFGMNWDAADECFGDLAELGSSGVLLQIHPAEQDRLELPVWLRFIGCLRDAASEFERDHSKKFVVVFYPETSAGSRVATLLSGSKLVKPPKR